MTERYLGSIISSSPVEPSSNLSNATASGVWNIHDPLIFGQAGDWPDPTNVPSVGIATRGQVNPLVTDIDKFVPESAGNATDFGDLTVARHASSSMGNDTRAIFAGGWDNYGGSSRSNVIDYITYATTGNATDFGDVAATTSDANASASNNVRGITFGGRLYSNGNLSNSIEYLTIASTGNAIDFGDLSVDSSNSARHRQGNGMSGSTTRGLASGGYTPAALSNVIQYVTIASTGNSTDFGDMSASTDELGFTSSNTRAVIAGGSGGGGSFRNTLEYVTIASTGNVTDFGDMTVAKAFLMGASSSTKGFILGGYTGSAAVNTIETITFSTTGDATDFGDLSAVSRSGSANASSHAAVQNEAGFPPAAIGLLAGGDGINSAGYQSAVIFLNITTDGQSGMFGELSAKSSRLALGTAASSTRGITRIGGSPNYTVTNELEYNTFSTKGAVTDFGNLTSGSVFGGALSNSTRGVVALGKAGTAGGEGTQSNTIDYFTIASAGNATDFGDLTITNQYLAGVAGTTRGIFAGGQPSGSYTDVIEYITIASTGNGTDFGDLIETNFSVGMVSSNTRAVMGSGGRSSNVMQYVTIASTGNGTDFGDATGSGSYNYATGLSASTIGVFHNYSGSSYNVDKITIASTGDAADWGDLTWGAGQAGGTSNAHGGLS